MDDKEIHALLFTAIKHHNSTLLEDLLNGDANKKFIDKPADNGLMPLHLAVIENDLSCVECLLKHGADPNVYDSIGSRTPLHLAVELDQTEILKAFLELDYINLDLRDDRNLTCHEIAQFCDNQTHADLIKARYEEIWELKDEFYSVMNHACATGETNLVKEILVKYEKRILYDLPKGWLARGSNNVFSRSILKELINWSSSSWNDVTLLFKSASKGYTNVCKLLIEYGAEPKCNENTNYSPLYVAAYGGFTSTVKLLLDCFPHLVKEVTIEKWTVLHACCLQGHSDTAELILNYPYLEDIKSRFVSRSGQYEHSFAFDLNAQDAAGQTVIYLSVSANDEKLLDTLLQFKIEAKLLGGLKDNKQSIQSDKNRSRIDEKTSINKHARIIPDRPKVTNEYTNSRRSKNQLDKIIKKLQKLDTNDDHLDEADNVDFKRDPKYLICPFEMDTYCDYNSKTALHLAVSQQYHAIATTLLVNGSNPNLPILSRDSIKSDFSNSNTEIGLNWLRSSKSTCLKEASRLNDEVMCDILIRYGASDNQDNLALQVAASNKNKRLISKFLSLKSNMDPEFKINRKCNVEFASRFKQSQKLSNTSQDDVTSTFSSMFPSNPVMIDWQNLKCVKQIDTQWLIDASLIHNKRLKHPTNSLMAITRLDLSSNNLKTVHPVIFRLPSLRELNLSGNRLESLTPLTHRETINREQEVSTTKLIESHKIAMKRSKSSNLSSINLETSNIIDINEPQAWDLPYLETVDLHDNLLISLPDCLFQLPRLHEIDVSSNQIRQLPWSMWTAPALREVIASGNLLDDLPRMLSKSFKTNKYPCLDSEGNGFSPLEGRISTASNHSTEKNDSLTLGSQESDSTRDHNSLPDSEDVRSCEFDCTERPIDHLNLWKTKIDIVSDSVAPTRPDDESNDNIGSPNNISKITHLNISHNSFETIPPVLACMAIELTRLNLSHNRLTSLGDIGMYPAKLKTVDLSNNQISSWFQSSGLQSAKDGCLSSSVRRDSLCSGPGSSICPHKSHKRLDNLKLINLNNNLLKDIQMTGKIESNSSILLRTSQTETTCIREQLLYPNITALDLSFNQIQQVPKHISELKDLSVLNLSGNISISTLPAELGLSSKLWNLGLNGCNLSEPLKSIVESKGYKTVDMIGYLRSILEEARPYARMKLMLVGLQGIGKTSLLEQMRLEGSTGNRRRGPEHWTKRMGHSNRNNLRNQKGLTLSTVGVDIHDWVFCKRTPRNQPNFGPVSFSTWDFGGQEEFYATHRYFLSRRSMYLVVWRLTDGLSGILSIQQWLVNIQSRAPSSPVIIVGTHEDLIEGGERGAQIQMIQSEVHRRFIDISDHDKCGLPRVVDSLVVSTKTKLNVKNLCNRIYDVVFSLRCPGTSERLLEQKIPATYLYLEEIINWIIHDRQNKKREPVLSYEEYRKLTSEQLKLKYNKEFRDLEPTNSKDINYNSELQQATRFLHENGVLLHYEDANLRDLYFLDPQWLCDILSHVVTIREINPHVKNGLMKIDDLGFLFKSIDMNLIGGTQSYVVNLLNKFEVALTWNSQYLLIPSLLPPSPSSINQQDIQLKMMPRSRGRSVARKYESNKGSGRSTSIGPQRMTPPNSHVEIKDRIDIDLNPDRDIYRLVMLRYLPAGFLARLQSAILSDPEYDDVCADLYANLSDQTNGLLKPDDCIGGKASWICWKNGIRLSAQQESTINSCGTLNTKLPFILNINEISAMTKDSKLSQYKFVVECPQANSDDNSSAVDQITSKWCNFDTSRYSNFILISVPSWKLRVTGDENSTRFVEPDKRCLSRLLSSSVDHIDNLLEDWYPSLGARFAHTLGGNYLVTRLIPCIHCSIDLFSTNSNTTRLSRTGQRPTRSNKTNFSISSARDQLIPQNNYDDSNYEEQTINCFYVEQCILQAYNISGNLNKFANHRKFSINSPNTKRKSYYSLKCPRHGTTDLSLVAPDILFDDIAEIYKIDNEQIERCKLIGRGTFGFVFKGTLRSAFPMNQLGQADQEIALKLLQPVDPGPDAEQSVINAYKSARSNWIREPFHSACKSYCTARHEINILQTIRHPNIVLFMGICAKPLAIILELAPLGCLTDIFKNYKRAGMRIDQYSVQKTLIQVAKALEYLHQQRVIYRDLKAENVLVWSFPSPFATNLESATVELKLTDYGISRQASSTGVCKGFAGTINFLAPEILRHNGDEEYTEKVDCFSFGMFMYELLTLRSPFKHNDGSKNHLADGGRPNLTIRDLVFPNHMIDLMSICWSQEPHMRPTASQIVSIASTPEFIQLLDVASIQSLDNITFASAIQYMNSDGSNLDFWFGQRDVVANIISANQTHWTTCQQLSYNEIEIDATCLCVLDQRLWLCDKNFEIHIMPLGYRSALKNLPGQETLNRCQSIKMKFVENCPRSPIKEMIYIKRNDCVIMLTSNGSIWVCHVATMICEQLDDGAIFFSCIAINTESKPANCDSHVYCGQSNGISCLDIIDGRIHRQAILPLAGKSVDLDEEYIVDPSQAAQVNIIITNHDTLWTAAGCTLHLWSLDKKCVVGKLDCWKLVPCSESLESINIEQYYEEARTSEVTSIVYLRDQLFVGTSHGCFMVIEANSLKPLIVFRPYEKNIRILKPILFKNNSDHEDLRYLVTVGTGYRDLMKRFVSPVRETETCTSNVAILWSSQYYYS